MLRITFYNKCLGELVAAVVTTGEHFKWFMKEESVVENARKRLWKHAVPVMVLVQDDWWVSISFFHFSPFVCPSLADYVDATERKANGKVMKLDLSKHMCEECPRRLKVKAQHSSSLWANEDLKPKV